MDPCQTDEFYATAKIATRTIKCVIVKSKLELYLVICHNRPYNSSWEISLTVIWKKMRWISDHVEQPELLEKLCMPFGYPGESECLHHYAITGSISSAAL